MEHVIETVHHCLGYLFNSDKLHSPLQELMDSQGFQRVLPDVEPRLSESHMVRRLIFCSGKFYFELADHREAKGLFDIAIVR